MLQLHNAIHRVYLHDQKIHLVSRSKIKKAKKYTKYFPFFFYGYFRSFLNVLVTFPNHFFINKDQPPKKTRPPPPPVLFHSRKKVAWQKEDIPKHLHQTKGHRATHGWCFLFHQKHIIFGRNPSSSRGMWKNNAGFFLGDTFWDDWLGLIFWKESGSTKKDPMEHPWTWMEWVEFRSYEIRKTCIQQCGIRIPIDNDNNPIDNNTIIRLWVYFRLNCHVLSTRISIQ